MANGEVLDCMSTMKKDNTGYDLKHLLIGSEGTLGVVTKVAVSCPRRPVCVNLVLLGRLVRWRPIGGSLAEDGLPCWSW